MPTLDEIRSARSHSLADVAAVSPGTDSPTFVESLFLRAADKVPGGRDILAGAVGSFGSANEVMANTFMLLDRASEEISDKTGLSKGDAFVRAEEHLRGRADAIFEQAAEIGTGEDDFGAKAARVIGGLPVGLLTAAAAVKQGGPVAGFAALGGLSEAHRGPKAAARGAATGAAIGALFPATARLRPAERLVTVGGGATTIEKNLGGQETEDAVLGGGVAGILAGVGARGRAQRKDLTIRAGETEVRTPEPAKAEVRKPKLEEVSKVEPAKSPLETATEKGLLEVTPKEVEAGRRVIEGDLPEPLTRSGKAIRPNLEKIEGPEDFKAMQGGLAEFYRSEIDASRRGTITIAEAKRLSERVGMTPEALLERRQGRAFNMEEMFAAERINQSVLAELDALGSKIRAGEGSPRDEAAFLRTMVLAKGTLSETLGAEAEAGRAFRALREVRKAERAERRRISELIDGFENQTGNSVKVMADMLGAAKSPRESNRIIGEFDKPTTSDKLLEIWINGLLSNPVTHAVNAISNAAVSLYRVPETTLARGIEAGPRAAVNEFMAQSYGIVEGGREGARLAGRVLRTGEPADPHSKIETRRMRAIMSKPGEFIRSPGRFLMAGDEFFKAIGYRQSLKSQAMKTAMDEGLRGRALGERVRALEDSPTPAMQEIALENARYQTFTNELGKYGKHAQGLLSHPAGKVIAPFVRTPTNIMKFGLERTPLQLVSDKTRLDLLGKNGKEARSQALAKISLGSGIMAWVASEAVTGNITGSGPTDPELRAAWFAAGNRPYSVRIGDQYVSYARLEPLGTILGLAADFAEISGHIEANGADELAAKIVMSVNRNITNKTFLSGVSALADALSDPDRFGQKFINNLAGSVVPSGVAQLARQTDKEIIFTDPTTGEVIDRPVMRETRTALDRIKSRLPGYASDLPPRRNIWGEPIFLDGGLGPDSVSPFYQSRLSSDFTTQEMVRIKAELSRPERKIQISGAELGIPIPSKGGDIRIQDLELTAHEYDRLRVLSGQIAKSRLDAIVSRPVWDQMPDGLKREYAESVYKASKQAGRALLMRELGPENIRERVLVPVERPN
jgi:hypothetical protein